jgi:hypothetical protein
MHRSYSSIFGIKGVLPSAEEADAGGETICSSKMCALLPSSLRFSVYSWFLMFEGARNRLFYRNQMMRLYARNTDAGRLLSRCYWQELADFRIVHVCRFPNVSFARFALDARRCRRNHHADAERLAPLT